MSVMAPHFVNTVPKTMSLRQGEHVEIHKPRMLVLVFLVKDGKTVFQIEVHCRQISVHCKEAESRIIGILAYQMLDNSHHIVAYMLSPQSKPLTG